MAKKLTPYEKVENFITKCHDLEVDKWNAGLSNNMEEWETFTDYWDRLEDVERLLKDNAEIRLYNDKLIEENKRLKEEIRKLKEGK